MTASIYRFSLAAFLLLTIFAFASAQDYRGKVQGAITDENGAAVPGAHVVLRNVATGVEKPDRQTTTDITSLTSSSRVNTPSWSITPASKKQFRNT